MPAKGQKLTCRDGPSRGLLRVSGDMRVSRSLCCFSTHPSLIPPGRSLLGATKFPVHHCRIRARSAQAAGKIWPRAGRERLDSNKFPVIFPVSRETTPRDWFAADCFLRQSVWSQHSLWACTRIQKPNSRGPLRENLCTPTHRRRPRILSLGPLVSEAPHFADLVRILRNANFVPLSRCAALALFESSSGERVQTTSNPTIVAPMTHQAGASGRSKWRNGRLIRSRRRFGRHRL